MSKIAIEEKIVKNFPWGPVVETHSIGEYFIVEYHPQIFKGCHGTRKHEETKTSFHPYINSKDTNNCFVSLDMALIGCICLKHDGINTRAPDYIYLMLEMGENRNS
jgi:hypothetical protein